MFVGMGANSPSGYNITDSLRFRSSASANLTYQNKTATDRTAWTYSFWVKRSRTGVYDTFFAFRTAGSVYSELWFTSNDNLRFSEYNNALIGELTSTAVYRDTSAWYHIVFVWDSANATSTDRCRLYVNGDRITSFSATGFPAQNTLTVSSTPNQDFVIGRENYSPQFPFDGYMTEIHSVDGQALDPSYFGETNADGVWSPIKYTGTYGTNGFYLPMKETTQADGFNTVLFDAQNSSQSITGVGFSPDLIWLKDRTAAVTHLLHDTIRGPSKYLSSSSTSAEATASSFVTSFDSDGFTLNSNGVFNAGDDIVAWCWDAGSSTVSNTDGDITSSVRANTDYGFSIVSYTGNGSANQTVGHGLNSQPELIITKNRDKGGVSDGWYTQSTHIDQNKVLLLESNLAAYNPGVNHFGDTYPTSSVFTVNGAYTNVSGDDSIAYCFHSVSGYSKIGTYTGTGATGNSITGLGFKPAFLLVKRIDADNGWLIKDNTRDVDDDANRAYLWAHLSNAEADGVQHSFDDDGFTWATTSAGANASGGTYLYMAFADTRDYQWNFDASGNKNNFTPNNINSNASSETTYDLMSDTPSLVDEDTGNFCTLNPLDKGTGNLTVSDANLKSSLQNYTVFGTMGVSSGKYYWEITMDTSVTYSTVGIGSASLSNNVYMYNQSPAVSYYAFDGTKYVNGTNTAYGATFTTGDVIGIALDADNDQVTFYKNNTSQGTITGLTSGVTWMPTISTGSTTYTESCIANFGQRPFKYTPPTGYKKLNTFNLPDSSITDGSQYMNPVLYTGNGTSQDITMDFSPDLVWVKNRNGTQNHYLQDSVRGATNYLVSNNTGAENQYSGFGVSAVTSFNTDGFSLGTDAIGMANTNSNSYVAWNWRGSDSTAVSNTDGTITSTVSANTTAGFSVVTYTGNSTSGSTIGHGLGVKPAMVILKNRDTAGGWEVWHQNLGSESYFIRLNETSVTYTGNTNRWTAFSNSTITLGDNGTTNASGNDYVAYCFADVEGFSKFGSYTGNGSTDGPFVYTGFRPAFVLIKRTDAGPSNWTIQDTSRDTYNVADGVLYPNVSNAETTSNAFDMLSNGFKLKNSTSENNASGGTYIYMAFAENPFKNSLAR